MTPNTSLETPGRKSEHLGELEEKQQRETNLFECHEAWYRPSRTPFEAGGGENSAQTAQRTEVLRAPSMIDDRSRDSFLRFRDEWVRNRARDIRHTRIISFNTCSEDTASITALNEFYRRRVFDGFKAEVCDEKESEIGMMQGSRNFGSLPKDVVEAEKLYICRIVCREKGRRIFKKNCR
jgi:hypothetical protein